MTVGRGGEVQRDLVMTWAEMPRSPGHAFYDKLQTLLTEGGISTGSVLKALVQMAGSGPL